MNLDPFDPANLVRGTIATAILFAVIGYFTRAKPKRILGVLIGSLPLIPMVMLYDIIAARFGLWYYSSAPGGAPGPFAWYMSAALFYGAGLGLIGWRVIRRFGKRGLIGFLIAFAAFGVTRDYIFSNTMGASSSNLALYQLLPICLPMHLPRQLFSLLCFGFRDRQTLKPLHERSPQRLS